MPAELATSLETSEADRLLQAEALVRAYCGWHVAPSKPGTATLRATPGASVLLLPSLHVTAVTVTVNGVELVAGTDYTWDEHGILKSYWWSTAYDVEIEFTHGYDTVPAEVAAIVQAAAVRAVANPGSLVRTQAGPFSETYSQSGINQVIPLTLLDAEKTVLDEYRIPGRP